LLSTWQLIQTCDDFCHSLRAVDTLKYFLNLVLPVGRESEARTSCLLFVGVLNTKDGFSFNIVWKRQFIAWIGLNFALAKGGGKNALIVRSKLHVTKFFVTCGVLESVGEVHACELARERSAAAWAAMVEGGGLVINPHKIT